MTINVCKPSPVSVERLPSVVVVGRRNPCSTRYQAQEEPSLMELVEDPLMRRLMASDGVPLESLMTLISETRSRLIG